MYYKLFILLLIYFYKLYDNIIYGLLLFCINSIVWWNRGNIFRLLFCDGGNE